MKVAVITLFPEMVAQPLAQSMVGRAQERKILELEVLPLRDFCDGKHKVADDAPFGGGGGMVIKAEPVLKAVQACRAKYPGARVIFLGPQGRRLDHEKVMELSALPTMILLCGHYEGIDQRALDAAVDEEISIGDYVLSGGEYAAAVLIDCVVRQLPGALGDENSAINDSFFGGILDYPHFTRPAELAEGKVPEVLLSGNHQEIQRWRREQALAVTLKKRPDLLDERTLNEADRAYLQAKRGQ